MVIRISDFRHVNSSANGMIITTPSPSWFLWVLPPQKIVRAPKDQTDRNLPRLMVSVLHSHTAPMLLYTEANAPRAPNAPPRESGLVTVADS